MYACSDFLWLLQLKPQIVALLLPVRSTCARHLVYIVNRSGSVGVREEGEVVKLFEKIK